MSIMRAVRAQSHHINWDIKYPTCRVNYFDRHIPEIHGMSIPPAARGWFFRLGGPISLLPAQGLKARRRTWTAAPAQAREQENKDKNDPCQR
jgi:hypothetical protein